MTQTAPRTATEFLQALGELAVRSPSGIPSGRIFATAKEFVDLDPSQIEKVLLEPDHHARVGAVSVMDFQARRLRTSDERRAQLFRLYLDRHDRIDTWDLVDRAAPHVVGGYLVERSRDPLYVLAASPRWWERRTAIVATWAFIRLGDLDDTFRIGELLAHDDEHFVQTAVGGWVREAGKRDAARLREWLDLLAPTLPRTALRFAIEKLPAAERKHYLGLNRATGAEA
jgi:hypothetical protein